MHVRQEICPVFQPDVIQFADTLPKTRSGKIMRRILKAIASQTDIGNITTLSDPSVVDTLFLTHYLRQALLTYYINP